MGLKRQHVFHTSLHKLFCLSSFYLNLLMDVGLGS